MVFRLTALWAGIYHLSLGVVGVFADASVMSSVIKWFFRANVEITPQVFYLIKFCSAYMIAFACATIILALNPVKYKSFVWVPLSLFAIRLLERLVFWDVLANSFGVPKEAELVTCVILLTMMALLYFNRPKEVVSV